MGQPWCRSFCVMPVSLLSDASLPTAEARKGREGWGVLFSPGIWVGLPWNLVCRSLSLPPSPLSTVACPDLGVQREALVDEEREEKEKKKKKKKTEPGLECSRARFHVESRFKNKHTEDNSLA